MVHTTDNLENISVIVPTRNELHNIPFFLASLPDAVELVVVDASDDGTDRFIEHHRPERTHLIRSDANIALARQIGSEVAQGEWLVYSDADIAFEPGYFSFLAQCETTEAFYGPKYATADYPRYSQFFNFCQRTVHRLGVPAASGSNMGVRRHVFEHIGGFRPDLPVNEDTELMMRVSRAGVRVDYLNALAVRSLDDRRLDRGVATKTLHSLGRNLLLYINLYIPLPRKWLSHDWGYWSISHANRTHY